jgi:N-ethylmaleimide reductase
MTMLFEPCQLGDLELANRIVMAPLTRCRANNPGFVPTPLMAQYYAQRAGAGLIVSEGAVVSPQGRGYPYTPGIFSPEQVNGWKHVTDAVHQKGGKIVCQLWHCGRLSLPEYHPDGLPVAPSAINPEWSMFTPEGPKPTVTPRALTASDIAQIVIDFGQAAGHAMSAGFDGVEIHASNGYLFHQFFSLCANTREDNYGGSHENRARFFFEVLEAVLKEVPAGRVGFRLNPMLNRYHGIMVTEDTVPMWSYVVEKANHYGLAYVHLTEPLSPRQIEGNPHALADVGAYFSTVAKMPIITNGALTCEKGEARLQKQLCTAVAYGVPWIANPDLVDRFRQGLPLNKADPDTFYQGGEKGYTDYPWASKDTP